ncbi:AraC family transcriptional regulator [Spongiivirga sp. MCCC 1A20706]|uniref:helix-turn-helix domain-containing protein n=1 Tax=Spongiivirga sp. MCCC 1A20706 TaxID=3160963 RepID=UPI0039778709
MTSYEEKLIHIKNSCYSNYKQIETIIETRNFIDNNFEKDLKLDVLSSIRFTSKYHLQRLFKRYYGQTPRQYLIEKRIEKSKEHLRNSMTVTETCFAVGFESLGSFSKLFKTKTGKSPSQFQKEQVSRSKIHSDF